MHGFLILRCSVDFPVEQGPVDTKKPRPLSGGVYEVRVLALVQRTRPPDTPPRGVVVVVAKIRSRILIGAISRNDAVSSRYPRGPLLSRLVNGCDLASAIDRLARRCFGLLLASEGESFYEVEDDTEALLVGKPEQPGSRPTRRRLIGTAAGLAASGGAVGSAVAEATVETKENASAAGVVEPFWGSHQGGITTPVQTHSYFAALDLETAKRNDVIKMLRAWTTGAAYMARGQPMIRVREDLTAPGLDSGEALGLPPSRLTVTFGFGAGLFVKDGKDRFGLAAKRPAALVDLPTFHGDQLVETSSGGDLSIQACADDPQVAFHAVRQLARLAYGKAKLRWAQTGYMTRPGGETTPRNLMGFKDGTSNPSTSDHQAMAKFVWVGDEGPDWMKGGSYVVARRIRIALERWDRMKVAFQEQTIGRHKYSGAPLGGEDEFDPLDLGASGKDGDPVIPDSAHVRLAASASNGGVQILRRPYSYNDGVNFTAERWPPWRQGMEYDAGLFFVCYQHDPRTGFIKIFDKLSKFDMLNQFATHTGGGLFACPGGVAKGEFIGQRLFETA